MNLQMHTGFMQVAFHTESSFSFHDNDIESTDIFLDTLTLKPKTMALSIN
jgi:hypothetical protein